MANRLVRLTIITDFVSFLLSLLPYIVSAHFLFSYPHSLGMRKLLHWSTWTPRCNCLFSGCLASTLVFPSRTYAIQTHQPHHSQRKRSQEGWQMRLSPKTHRQREIRKTSNRHFKMGRRKGCPYVSHTCSFIVHIPSVAAAPRSQSQGRYFSEQQGWYPCF